MSEENSSNATVAEFIRSFGTVFEFFLSQDSGNKCYSIETSEGRKWIKVLNLKSTPLGNPRDTIDLYNSLRSELIPQNWNLVELADGTIMTTDWVAGKVLNSPEEVCNI
ncbi:MAG: hypothetical protein HN368_11250 [Spirochaetales bacterium]|jgi:hypothetical protein|nr:hypothetical protein [Spirochaetales bacterium]